MVVWQGITEGGTAVPVQVTEAGKVVAEGRQGPQGPQGPQGSEGPQGPPGQYSEGDDVDFGKITATGDSSFAGDVTFGPSPLAQANSGTRIFPTGAIMVRASNTSKILEVYEKDAADRRAAIYGNGNATFAGILDLGSKDNAGKIQFARGADGDTVSFIGYPTVDNNNEVRFENGSGDGVLTFYTAGSERLKIYSDGSIAAGGAENTCGFTKDGELYFTSRGTRYKLVVQGALCNAEPYTREMELRERVADKRKPRSTDSVPED